MFLLLPPAVAAASSAPFADRSAIMGIGAATFVALFAAITASALSTAGCCSRPRCRCALAKRGVLPAWFAKESRRGVPVRAQIAGCVLTTGLIAANYTRGLTELFAFMALLATAATLVLYLTAALATLRRIGRGELRGIALAILASIGAVYSAWTFYGAGKEATLWGGAAADRDPGLSAHAPGRPLQPGGGGKSSRVCGMIRRSF